MQITVEKSANDNKAQVKSPKIVTVENPYFIKEENEAVIEQKRMKPLLRSFRQS